MLDRLDRETRAHHPDADSPWVSLLSTGLTRARYIDHLVAVYGFEAPLEAALALTPRARQVWQLRRRSRAGRLVQDLLALGLTPSHIARLPQCASFSLFRDACEALGWVYVVERSARLHDAVLRMVARRMPEAACTYLAASVTDAEARWEALGEVLDRAADAEAAAAELVEAAHVAFATQRAWFLGEPRAAARGA